MVVTALGATVSEVGMAELPSELNLGAHPKTKVRGTFHQQLSAESGPDSYPVLDGRLARERYHARTKDEVGRARRHRGELLRPSFERVVSVVADRNPVAGVRTADHA